MIVNAINLQELFISLLSISILILSFVCLIISISFFKYRYLIRNGKWERIINQKIMNIIINENLSINDEDKEFEELIQTRKFRNLCVQIMIETEKKFSGSVHKILNDFYYMYGLDKDSVIKLKTKNKYVIAKGIQELTAMKVAKALPIIDKLTHHENKHVYQEAQFSMVSFKAFDGLSFLNKFENQMSNWQQLRLLKSISTIPENGELLLKKWLTSNNVSTVVFSLRLISKFQIRKLYSDVLKLLYHNNLSVQIASLNTLHNIENERTLNDVIKFFNSITNTELQLKVLKVLKNINDNSCIPFLKHQFLHHKSNSVKLSIAELFVQFNQEDFLNNLMNDKGTKKELVKIIKHTLQEKIC